MLLNRVTEKEPTDCSDDAEGRNYSKNQKLSLHCGALNAGLRIELSHAGPLMSTAIAELKPLSGVGCRELLGSVIMLQVKF